MLPVTITPAGHVVGPDHFRAKMTYEKAAELRQLRQQFGMTYRTLGAMFGIDHKTARSIAIGKTWAPAAVKVVFRAGTEEIERIRSMVAEGAGIKKAARTLGVTEASIKRMMRSNGIQSKNTPIGQKTKE